MNLLEDIKFSLEKPSVLNIKKTNHLKQFVVGLGKNAVLKKHTTSVPTQLLVLKGEINFYIQNKILTYREMDVFEIPIDIQHEVKGVLEENLFLITQEF